MVFNFCNVFICGLIVNWCFSMLPSTTGIYRVNSYEYMYPNIRHSSEYYNVEIAVNFSFHYVSIQRALNLF